MKLLIGTLYTQENEIDQCIDSIAAQSHRDFEHMIIRNLGKKEAHDKLYGEFMSRREEFQLLVKVDADMVLCDQDFFSNVVKEFQKDAELECLSIAVHDWFTDRLAIGLNVYRNSLDLLRSGDSLFTDRRVERGSAVCRRDTDQLAPCALHCPDPSPFQAFHFGLHRGLKVVQRYSCDSERVKWRMKEHWDNIFATEQHFDRCGDRRLGLAVLAAELTFAGTFEIEHSSYQHPYPHQVFKQYCGLDAAEIRMAIDRIRQRNMGWMPNHMRCEWLWYRWRHKRTSLHAFSSFLVNAFLRTS